jgi:hypothetical protein
MRGLGSLFRNPRAYNKFDDFISRSRTKRGYTVQLHDPIWVGTGQESHFRLISKVNFCVLIANILLQYHADLLFVELIRTFTWLLIRRGTTLKRSQATRCRATLTLDNAL